LNQTQLKKKDDHIKIQLKKRKHFEKCLDIISKRLIIIVNQLNLNKNIFVV